MTTSGDTAETLQSLAMKAEFIRILSESVRLVSGDPKQMRDMVYELARIKLAEQFGHEDARHSRQTLRVFDSAVDDVEQIFAQQSQAASSAISASSPSEGDPAPRSAPAGKSSESRALHMLAAFAKARSKRSVRFGRVAPIAAACLILTVVAAGIYFLRLQRSDITAVVDHPAPAQSPAPAAREPEAVQRPPEATATPSVSPAAEPAFPLPTTFGVFVLSDGQLQELKVLPGKVPDRRVAISAAIPTPSQTTVASGEVKFISFRPEVGGEAAGPVEVRVVARVSRTMGVDSTGKAKMAPAGDSWVIRSAAYPFKVGPVEDQPRMLLIQPENDSLVLSPGRYVVVIKGIGYDFTIAGEVTDPNQCVERVNAVNGAFYSPCPKR